MGLREEIFQMQKNMQKQVYSPVHQSINDKMIKTIFKIIENFNE